MVIHERTEGAGLDSPDFATCPTLEEHVLEGLPLRPQLLETSTENVYYLPRSLRNDTEALAPTNSDLNEFLAELAAFFPQVIVNAPGIFTSEFREDPLSRRASRGILVTDEDQRHSDAVRNARRRLAAFQIRLLATILRKSDGRGDILRLNSPEDRATSHPTG